MYNRLIILNGASVIDTKLFNNKIKYSHCLCVLLICLPPWNLLKSPYSSKAVDVTSPKYTKLKSVLLSL